MKCPYCKKEDFIPAIVFGNAEHYMPTGFKTYYARCLHCDKVLEIELNKSIRVNSVSKSLRREGDWG